MMVSDTLALQHVLHCQVSVLYFILNFDQCWLGALILLVLLSFV